MTFSSISDNAHQSLPHPSRKKRKSHKNSKFGCSNCKKRRIKCGEELDSCFNCLDKNYRCGFLDLTTEERSVFLEHKKLMQKLENDAGHGAEGKLADGAQSNDNFKRGGSRKKSSVTPTKPLSASLGSASASSSSTPVPLVNGSHLPPFNAVNAEDGDVNSNLVTDGSGLPLDIFGPYDNDLELFNKTDCYYNVEQLPKGRVAHKRQARMVSDYCKKYENKMFYVYDFTKDWKQKVRPGEIISQRQIYISNKQAYTPLPDHVYSPTSFKIYKHSSQPHRYVNSNVAASTANSNYKNTVSGSEAQNVDQRSQLSKSAPSFGTVARCCRDANTRNNGIYGDEDIFFRDFVISLYEAISNLSSNQLILFYASMSYASAIMYNKTCKKHYYHQKSESMTSLLNFKTFLFKYNQSCRVQVTNLSHRLIERLNTLGTLTEEDCYLTVTLAISKTLTEVNQDFLLNYDYKSLYESLNQYLLTILAKHVVENFKLAMTKVSPTSPQYEYFLLLDQKVTFMHIYFMRCVTSVFIPNYNFNVLIEFYDSLVYFGDYTLSDPMAGNPDLTWKMKNQFKELKNYLNDDIFKNPSLLSGQNEKNKFVVDYTPQELIKILKKFLQIVPSEVVNLQSSYKSLTVFEKIFYLFWIACIRVLNNLFHETTYLFFSNFFGNLTTWGNSVDLIQSILSELTVTVAPVNHALYESSYRQTIYLSRLIFFFTYRSSIYYRNLELVNPFPNDIAFDKVRLASRKIKFVKETQLSSFKNSIISFENYPTKDLNYVAPRASTALSSPSSAAISSLSASTQELLSPADYYNPGHNPDFVRFNVNFQPTFDPNVSLHSQAQQLQLQEITYTNRYSKSTSKYPPVTLEKSMDANYPQVQQYLLQLYHYYKQEFSIDTCPLELLQVCPTTGLIQNIDYGPHSGAADGKLADGNSASDSGEKRIKSRFNFIDYESAEYEDGNFFKRNEVILQHYVADRLKVLDYFNEHFSQKKD